MQEERLSVLTNVGTTLVWHIVSCRALLAADSRLCYAVFAAAPVLFVTCLYPFVAYWLIWGGTLWSPVFALAGIVVGYLVYSKYIKAVLRLRFLGVWLLHL